ncbi:MAG: twin-arginine translocase subunit TatC [Phycisphaerae bacterium]|nr:twin-arginine translocase subunit TatC [Phycisphaerae bacterium]
MGRIFRSIPKDQHPDEVRMTLGEHLDELRSRLIRALVALFVGAMLCWFFIDEIMGFLTSPLFAVLRANGIETRMVALNPAENFITFLKVAVIVGFILSAPYSITQIWGFVAAGLYPHERKWIRMFAPASIALFFTGALFLLLVAAPLLLSFLVTYKNTLPNYDSLTKILLTRVETMPVNQPTPENVWPATQPIPTYENDPANPPESVPWINRTSRDVRIRIGDANYILAHLEDVHKLNRLDPMMRVADYVVFILQLSAAFGIGFQVPVVVAFLATLGILSTAQMSRYRRHVIFGMAIVAAIVTPPDVTSMMLLLLPMIGLFEVGLLVGRVIERKRATQAAHAAK